ncbi:MAG: hypothetical protein RL885_19440 [Planctomycetota bacterium]
MKIKKLLSVLLWMLAIGIATLWIGLLAWNDSGHLQGLVLEELRARLPEGYDLWDGEITVVPTGLVEIRDLKIGEKHGEQHHWILSVERCRVQIDFAALAAGDFPVSSIDLLRPSVKLRIGLDGTTNFDRLIAAFESEKPSEELPVFPEVTLREGSITATYGPESAPLLETVELSDLTVLCRPSSAHRARISAWLTAAGGHLHADGELEVQRGEDGPTLRTPEPIEASARALDLKLASSLGGEWPKLLSEHALRGRLDARAELHFGPGGEPGRLGPVQLAELRVEDGEALPSLFPYPISELGLSARFDWQNGLQVQRIDGRVGTARLRGQAEWLQLKDPDSLALVATLEDLRLVPMMKRTIDQAVSPQIWEIANPVDVPIDLEIQVPFDPRPIETAANLSVRARAVVRGGSLRYSGVFQPRLGRRAGFPYPVSDLHGQVIASKVGPGFSNVRIQFDEVTATAGTGTALCEGSLIVTPETDVLNLRIDAKDITLDETLRATIEEAFEITELWERLSPSGTSGGGYRSIQPPGRDSTELAYVNLQDASAQYDAVPYPLHHLRGLVEIFGRRVAWEDVVGRNGSNRVTIDGELVTREGGDELTLGIRGEDIAFDWSLRDALCFDRPRIAEYWDDFNPRDRAPLVADVDFRGYQPAGTDDFFFEVTAGLRSGELLAEVFPVQLSVEEGVFFSSLQPEGLEIEIENLVGRTGPDSGTITVNGRVEQLEGAEDPELALDFEADEVALNFELLEALKGVNESSQTVLDLLTDPRGRFDASVALRGPADPDLLRVKANLWAKEASFALGPGQKRLEHFDGHFDIDSERVLGQDLRVAVAGGILRCPELVVSLGEESWLTGRFRGEGLPFEKELLEHMPPRLRESLDMLEAETGELDFAIDSFRARLGDEGATDVTLTARIDLRRCTGQLGFAFENWSGRLRLDRFENAIGRLVTTGELRDAQLDFLGERLSDLEANFQFDDRRLVLDSLEGTFYSGRILAIPGSVYYDFGGGYGGTVVATGSSLRQLVGDRIAIERNIFGTLQGQLDFKSPDGTLDNLKGQGTIEIFEGRIWDFPILADMSRVLSGLLPVEPPAFRTGQLAFEIHDRELIVEHLAFQSPVLDLAGRGQLRFDGVVDVTLEPSVQSPISFPILSQLLDIIGGILGGSVGSFRIHGMISAPATDYTSFVDSVTSLVRKEVAPRKIPFTSPARERRRPPRF